MAQAGIAANIPPAEAPQQPAPYELVDGNQLVEAANALNEVTSLQQILHWIGFTIEEHRENLRIQSLGSYEDMKSLTEKDCQAISTDWAGRTVPNGRFHVGLRRLKLLQALIHWVQDFRRISSTPTIVGLNAITFKSALSRALDRATIRKSLRDQSSSASAAASPGPLESERKWKAWEEKFVNYCRSHLGANGIPLSYVIRENDEPATDAHFGDFVTRTIACAPLSGEFYEADRMTVFNFLVSFTTDQPSGDWIKSTLRYNNGRRSMKALRNHFAGEGNASRNKAEADRLKESLHYKNERAMTFEIFLTQCQKMYNIYEKEEEGMSEDAKIRFLFKRIQHPALQPAIEALKVKQSTNEDLTYSQVANHMATAVSELPEFLSKHRTVSSANTTTTPATGDSSIYNSDGSIITGHIPNWRNLSPADRQKVFAERKRNGVMKNKGGDDKAKSARGQKASESNRFKQLSNTNKRMKRQIKAFKRSSTDGDNDKQDSDSDTDAGDQFGGKASKKKHKKN